MFTAFIHNTTNWLHDKIENDFLIGFFISLVGSQIDWILLRFYIWMDVLAEMNAF